MEFTRWNYFGDYIGRHVSSNDFNSFTKFFFDPKSNFYKIAFNENDKKNYEACMQNREIKFAAVAGVSFLTCLTLRPHL